MRKFILPAVAFGLSLSAVVLFACSSQSASPAPAGTPAFVESSAPSAAVSASPADWTKDVTDVSAKAEALTTFPEGDTARLSFTITNHGTDAATYTVIFAVYDKSGAQTTAIGVDTGNSGYAPTKPGGILKVSGPWGTTDGAKLPVPFTVAVQSVDRIPAGQ
jgi:hypothetical protein